MSARDNGSCYLLAAGGSSFLGAGAASFSGAGGTTALGAGAASFSGAGGAAWVRAVPRLWAPGAASSAGAVRAPGALPSRRGLFRLGRRRGCFLLGCGRGYCFGYRHRRRRRRGRVTALGAGRDHCFLRSGRLAFLGGGRRVLLGAALASFSGAAGTAFFVSGAACFVRRWSRALARKQPWAGTHTGGNKPVRRWWPLAGESASGSAFGAQVVAGAQVAAGAGRHGRTGVQPSLAR